jgi:hypothetical protein
MGRMFVALAVVLVLLGGLAWLLRRGVLARRQSGALGVETALALGDRRSLVTELGPASAFDAALARAGQERPQA